MAAVSAFYQEEAFNHVQEIKEKVAQVEGEWLGDSLSQTAVRAIRSTSGISSVLVGMRHQAYVDDVIAELKQPCQKKNRIEAWKQLSLHM